MAKKKSAPAGTAPRKRGRSRAAETADRNAEAYRSRTPDVGEVEQEGMSASEHYRRERERRLARLRTEADPMEAARQQYRALLDAEAAKGKGGRPRKTAARAARKDTASGPDAGEDDATDG